MSSQATDSEFIYHGTNPQPIKIFIPITIRAKPPFTSTLQVKSSLNVTCTHTVYSTRLCLCKYNSLLCLLLNINFHVLLMTSSRRNSGWRSHKLLCALLLWHIQSLQYHSPCCMGLCFSNQILEQLLHEVLAIKH